jgi:hypothetical protein
LLGVVAEKGMGNWKTPGQDVKHWKNGRQMKWNEKKVILDWDDNCQAVSTFSVLIVLWLNSSL